MNKQNNNYIWTFVLPAVLAFFMIVSIPDTAVCDQVPKLDVENSTRTVPNADGFIQRWLILEPIAANGDTQNAVQGIVKTEHFPNELTMIGYSQRLRTDMACRRYGRIQC